MKIKYFFLSVLVAATFTVVGGNAQAAQAPIKQVKSAKGKVSGANVFNRLLKKEKQRNAPPPEDGIHDPANDGTHVLQPPLIAYDGLPKTEFGNYVDWVKALNDGLLKPRYDRFDPTVEPLVMDLDIVREVKASMPDVVFPHKPHTQWLHCSNCHPKIFIPQRKANVINMSAILLGQKCGVCHGKVSFPITTKSCTKCHSKPKPADWKPPKSEASLKNPWR
ncbi:MAG TPA: cytochrome c, class I [Gammaproteobacteria bacterium]|nr:cytochrome c, class I [Gammaproteobacteria bacterium]